MSLQEQRGEILKELEVLNKAVHKQNSVPHIFMKGIIYGVGFVVGSAVFATLLLGVFGPLFAQIPWVRSTFEAGASLMGR